MDLWIRPFRPTDKGRVMSLAERLSIGVAPWRDRAAVARAVEGWVEESTEPDTTTAAFVAEAAGEVIGFVSVSSTTHFCGEVDAYIGELIVHTDAEGRGVATRLIAAAEEEAVARGYRCITLTTGAANQRALGLYRARGYQDEDVKLTKVLAR